MALVVAWLVVAQPVSAGHYGPPLDPIEDPQGYARWVDGQMGHEGSSSPSGSGGG